MYENKTQGLRTTVPTFILKCEENNNNINDNNNNCESNLEKKANKTFSSMSKKGKYIEEKVFPQDSHNFKQGPTRQQRTR